MDVYLDTRISVQVHITVASAEDLTDMDTGMNRQPHISGEAHPHKTHSDGGREPGLFTAIHAHLYYLH